MSKYYHRPLSREDEASTRIFNQRFSQLDAAIAALYAEGQVIAEAGEALSNRSAAYLDLSDNKIYRMDANASGPKAGAIRGFVVEGVSMGQRARLILRGFMTGFSGLSPWQAVYASSTAGGITQTKPGAVLGGGQLLVAEMGFATAADTIYIQKKPILYQIRDAFSLNETATILHHADSNAYKRLTQALVTETEGVTDLATYASSNQDVDVGLQGPSGAGGTVTITASGGSASIGNPSGNQQKRGQSFLVINAGILNQITFRLATDLGFPVGNITWSVCLDSAGLPGAALATGSLVPVSDATNTISVTGSNRIFLEASTYWLVLETGTQLGSTAYRWQSANTNPYANGVAALHQLGSWSTQSGSDYQMSVQTNAVSANEKLEQGFQLAGAGNAGVVELWLKKVGAPTGTLTAKIYSDSGGSPNTLLGTSLTVAAASLSSGYTAIAFQFASLALSGSTQYHVVLETSDAQSNTNYIVWGADGSAPSYASGQMKSYNSGAWAAESKDAIFTVKSYAIGQPSAAKVGWWSSTFADMVNRYGDGSGADLTTKTTFKCLKAAGFADVTVSVMLD